MFSLRRGSWPRKKAHTHTWCEEKPSNQNTNNFGCRDSRSSSWLSSSTQDFCTSISSFLLNTSRKTSRLLKMPETAFTMRLYHAFRTSMNGEICSKHILAKIFKKKRWNLKSRKRKNLILTFPSSAKEKLWNLWNSEEVSLLLKNKKLNKSQHKKRWARYNSKKSRGNVFPTTIH